MITRRDFFVTTAVGAAGVATLGAETTTTPAPVAAEATARYEWIIGKWGTRFTEEQKAEIRRLLIDNEKGLATLRAFPLGNETEPAR
jgi:hypothetical protein